MSNSGGYTIEMVEFVDGKPVPFAPVFGAFLTLLAAEKAVALRLAFSAPRANPIGYRILDPNNRVVVCWSEGLKAKKQTPAIAAGLVTPARS